MQRRDFLIGAGAAGLAVGLGGARATAPARKPPRRLLAVFVTGGWDTSYAIDPKDAAYVDVPAGKVQRYAGLDVFVHEPAGVMTFVTDPSDVKSAGDDRREMVAPAVSANKAGDTAGALRLFFDGVNGQSGIFDMLSPAARSGLLDNARTIPLHFGAPPPPALSCAQLGQIKVPVTVAKGELTRASFRIPADTASRCMPGSRLVVVSQGRHSAAALTPAAFNEALLEFLKNN